MRYTSLIIFFLIVLMSCGRSDKHARSNTGSIDFITVPVQSPSLLVRPALKCFPGKQDLELRLQLQNLVSEKITIKEVVLSNARGLNSSESFTGKIVKLAGDADTTLLLTIRHIHDKSLFQSTGLPGLIDSVYNLSVFYSVEGKEGTRVVNLKSRMPDENFLAYRKAFEKAVQIYYFDTSTDFNDTQRKFLETTLAATTPPFVHLTQQEVAVSGLNFRIRCYHTNDTLRGEIFAVNHSDMTVRIDTSGMQMITGDSQAQIDATALNIEKVTGSKDEADMLRKGDRAVITMRKYMGDYPGKISFTFSQTFFLPTGRSLFSENLKLERAVSSLASN